MKDQHEHEPWDAVPASKVKEPFRQFMAKVGNDYTVHDSIAEARAYEKQFNPNGFTHWHEEPSHKRSRRFRIEKRHLLNIITLGIAVSLPIVGTLVILALSSCAPAKKFNDPAAMRRIERQMNQL